MKFPLPHRIFPFFLIRLLFLLLLTILCARKIQSQEGRLARAVRPKLALSTMMRNEDYGILRPLRNVEEFMGPYLQVAQHRHHRQHYASRQGVAPCRPTLT